MARYRFRLLNVFAESTFGGNPLCVFENGAALSDETMQKLASQFNLSETVFLFPSDRADARMRIFTPTTELPFAGHPTLGTAHVVRQMGAAGTTITLEMSAGIVPVTQQADRFTLTAPGGVSRAMRRACDVELGDLCHMLGIAVNDVASAPCWIDTGSEQLLLPLHSSDAVSGVSPGGEFAARWPGNLRGRKNVLVFAFNEHKGQQNERARQLVTARYFFVGAQGAVEDPGTGSACANLGAWLALQQHPLPLHLTIHQGDAIDRPSRLSLDVTSTGDILVGGGVIETGQGWIELPSQQVA